MKNKKILRLLLFFIVVLFGFILYLSNSKNGLFKDKIFPSLAYEENDKGSKNPDSYWSIKNKPIIYGATKITIKKGMVDNFDVNDTRFRVFAKDFEDGDLTTKLTYTGNVDVNVVGTYQIHYSVSDSHGNTSTLDVPVIVTDEENAKINVERTLYTTPSTWNIDQTGFVRGSRGERQILGIYMPANSSIRVRVLSSDNDISISFSANDSAIESSVKISNNKEWVTIKNVNNNISYDSVPLFYTSIMGRGVDLDKTYKVELEYDNSVKELNYYHQNDNEKEFRDAWNNSKNKYSVIENEVITVLVPYEDINKLTNYHKSGFTSLDQFLEYWQKVVDRMDELVGLDLNPVSITDQNVRTKYFVKANVNGAGAAYYGADHVGIHNAYINSFFEMNWGGLHEFAHGYQGNLGKGYMDLGEVSNNILGHYIQIDKNIYFHNADWLGDLAKTEDARNSGRLDGQKFNEISVGDKLYVLINLFDSIDGANTYTNIFKWFRENINNKTITDINNNMDCYVQAISNIYHINIIPYFEDWGLTVSENVKDEVYAKNDKILTILNDILNNDSLTKVLNGENIDRKYSLVSNDILSKYDIKSSVKIKIDIDDLSKLYGKKIDIMSGSKVIKTIRLSKESIIDNVITINDLNVGTYYVKMPIITNYSQKQLYIKVSDKNINTIEYQYEKIKEKDYNNYTYLDIRGYVYDSSVALRIQFADNYRKAIITNPQASRMNGGEYVRIYDTNGKIIFEDIADVGVLGNSNFRAKSAGTYDLEPGYIIEVYYPDRFNDRVRMYSTLTDDWLTNYNATNDKTRYVVIENGIKRADMDDDEVYKSAYEILKNALIKIIEEYEKKATDEVLNNRFIDFREKQEVISAYEKLENVDKKPYEDFILRIIRGGIPEVKLNGVTEYNVNDSIDLYQLVVATDPEDGEILINEDSTEINTNLNMNKAGVYSVIYRVKDSDQNVSTYEISIKVNELKNSATITKPEDFDNSNLSGNNVQVNNGKNPSGDESNNKPNTEDYDTPLKVEPVEEVIPIVEKGSYLPYIIILLLICGVVIVIYYNIKKNYKVR